MENTQTSHEDPASVELEEPCLACAALVPSMAGKVCPAVDPRWNRFSPNEVRRKDNHVNGTPYSRRAPRSFRLKIMIRGFDFAGAGMCR